MLEESLLFKDLSALQEITPLVVNSQFTPSSAKRSSKDSQSVHRLQENNPPFTLNKRTAFSTNTKPNSYQQSEKLSCKKRIDFTNCGVASPRAASPLLCDLKLKLHDSILEKDQERSKYLEALQENQRLQCLLLDKEIECGKLRCDVS